MTPHQRLTLTRFALDVLKAIDGKPCSHHLSVRELARLTPGLANIRRRRTPDGQPDYPARSPRGYVVRVNRYYQGDLDHARSEQA